MGWLPGATVRDIGAANGRYTNGPMHSYLGAVLHVNAADSGDLYDWIVTGAGGNPMSCHFQVLKDGTIYQYIPTEFSSWCQADGNNDYLSIETSGLPTEPLTAEQVAAVAKIMAYVHETHGIPLVVTDTVGNRGLIAHGDGGEAWGGHAACPGDLRKAQRQEILTLAGGTATTGGFLMALTDKQQLDLYNKFMSDPNNGLSVANQQHDHNVLAVLLAAVTDLAKRVATIQLELSKIPTTQSAATVSAKEIVSELGATLTAGSK